MSESIRILLVEDNPHVREMLSYGLERRAESYVPNDGQTVEVKTAADGQQALELLRANAFDLIIVDWYMPVLDGQHVIHAVRESSEKYCKILAISASSVTAHKDAITAGADMFLRKPLRLADLIDAVKTLLG